MWAAPIFKADVPNALESLIRTRAPPMVGHTTMRTVWLSNTGGGGRPGKGSGACMAALHVLTQCSWTLGGSAPADRLATTTRKIKTPRDFVFSIFSFPHNRLHLT